MRFKAAQAKSEGDQSAIKEIEFLKWHTMGAW